jgi:ADP-heptose:LPS heptosyltransferase
MKLVVLRALGLGDLLTAVPALRALARAFAGHECVLLAPAALAPLVELLGDAAYALHHVDGVRALPAVLPRAVHGADVAVNLHGRGPQSTALLRAAQPQVLVAFGRQAAWREGERETVRWCRLLEAVGVAADPADLDLDLEPPAEPTPHAGAAVIHPGASAPARRWPAARWAAVGRELPGPVVVTAGPGEQALARAVAREAGATVFAGDLRALAALVASAARVLCADTGVAHLATALGTPSVVLFGPTPPAHWGPPPERTRHRVLWAGGRGDPNGARTDPGLLTLQPHDVLEAIA